MEFLLKSRCKISRHLADGVASGVSDSGMGIAQEVQHAGHNLVQDGLHLLVTALTDGRDGHEGGKAVFPISMTQHGWQGVHHMWQNDLSAQTAGEAIQRGLCDDVVVTMVIVIHHIGGGPVLVLLQVGHHLQHQRDQGHDVLVGAFPHHGGGVLGQRHHNLQDQVTPAVLKVLRTEHLHADLEDELQLRAQELRAVLRHLNEQLEQVLIVLRLDGLASDNDHPRQHVRKVLVDGHLLLLVVEKDECADSSHCLHSHLGIGGGVHALGQHLLDQVDVLCLLVTEYGGDAGKDPQSRLLELRCRRVGTLEEELQDIRPLIVAVLVDQVPGHLGNHLANLAAQLGSDLLLNGQ